MAHDKEKVMHEVCKLISTTNRGLKSICQEVGVGYSTVTDWIRDDTEISVKYARAKEQQMDYLADEILEISDFTAKDTIETDKGPIPDSEWINRSRLRVDARKWLMSKLAPKKYGDKIQQEITGANGGPIQVTGMQVI